MTEPALAEIFGLGASQNATTVTIQKADLAGLTPATENNAEAIFAAIINTARANLTEDNRTVNPVDRNVTIVPPNNNVFTDVDNVERLAKSFIVQFFTEFTDTEFDPDDY